jgi:uncharacterized protein (DUF924 family)
MHYETIIDFWFKEIEPKFWWKKDSEFDRLIADRFMDAHKARTGKRKPTTVIGDQ